MNCTMMHGSTNINWDILFGSLFVCSFVCFKTLSETPIIQRENCRTLKIMNLKGFVKKSPWPNVGSVPIFGLQQQKKPTNVNT